MKANFDTVDIFTIQTVTKNDIRLMFQPIPMYEINANQLRLLVVVLISITVVWLDTNQNKT